MSNGRLRLAIPPGHADAHCLTCRTDVVIPEGTLRCPNGDHDVEVTSLPRMPEPDLPVVAPAAVTLQGERRASATTAEPLLLPSIREAISFGRATEDLLAALDREEAQALADFESARERVKAARRARSLLGQVRDLVRAPEKPAPAGERRRSPAPLTRWSRKHDACVVCGRTDRKHKAQGKCGPCYDRVEKVQGAAS